MWLQKLHKLIYQLDLHIGNIMYIFWIWVIYIHQEHSNSQQELYFPSLLDLEYSIQKLFFTTCIIIVCLFKYWMKSSTLTNNLASRKRLIQLHPMIKPSRSISAVSFLIKISHDNKLEVLPEKRQLYQA